MSPLDWTKFDNSPGSQSDNFERLCRQLIRLNFARYGEYRALKNQPGIEVDLKLSRECQALGEPPRWYGWQCKLHKLTNDGHLRSSSKQDIEKSLCKTVEHFPKITDWVLWTRHILSSRDKKWFDGLRAKFNLALHDWNEEEIITYLGEHDSILRKTYFGDLIATLEDLKQQHQKATRPIRERWFEPVHQSTDEERTLRQMLGEQGSWNYLKTVGKRLAEAADIISDFSHENKHVPETIASHFISACRKFADILVNFHKVLADGDLEIIQQHLQEQQSLIDDGVKFTPHRFRKLNIPVALDATNALRDMRIACNLLDNAKTFLSEGVVALIAEAGGGKTQISAQITSPQEDRPAGVLLLGRHLHRGENLDNLARNYSLNNKPIGSIEQLLAVLDAAAKRSRCRLPLVIDGLNEAENPRDWRDPLFSLCSTVKSYPNVLVICTLRPGGRSRGIPMQGPQTDVAGDFIETALPDSNQVKRIESDGFRYDTKEAIKRYFNHFKISLKGADIPVGFFNHPLTLRIFCQVTNPKRESVVAANFSLTSLASLFREFVANSAKRISEMPNLRDPYYAGDVTKALYRLGILLWDGRAREVSEACFREKISDSERSWDHSLVNLLVQEGVIIRNPGTPDDNVIAATHDVLGGYIIADSLLQKYFHDTTFQWLNNSDTINLFAGENPHPLATDIFKSLVALTPQRMHGKQLWAVVPDRFRNAAIRYSTSIDARLIDEETVSAIKKLSLDTPQERPGLYSRLHAFRSMNDHPLNAEFLDAILRLDSMSERDLNWTEWARKNCDGLFKGLLSAEKRWRKNLSERRKSDRLRAKWFLWYLTSTNRELRDVATRALYWYGRGAPSALFEETLSSLEINDPYVPERMFAASYGVAMALHNSFDDESFRAEILPEYARRIFDALFSEEAPHRTSHVLLCEYASRIVEIAVLHNPGLFSDEELSRTKPPFSGRKLPVWGEEYNQKPADTPFMMDFENYTLGRLVPDRANYDYKHPEYQKIKAQVLWRVRQLGWSSERFGNIDNQIMHDQRWRMTSRNYEPKKIERYGKKYSWIAYFEKYGLLHDQKFINTNYYYGRPTEVDIDPSFPKRPRDIEVVKTDLLGDTTVETDKWISNAEEPNISRYLQIARIGDFHGPWIALDGGVFQEDEKRGRRFSCFIRSFMVANAIVDTFLDRLSQLERLSKEEFGGATWWPRKPEMIYTYAGEIPWCTTYPPNLKYDFFHETDKRNLELISLPALIPVCDFCWESYHSATNDAGLAVTLDKGIADDLRLVNQPQEFDLFTKKGVRATLNISKEKGNFNIDQAFFFMQKELLQTYLQRNKCSLIWTIWGGRDYSVDLAIALANEPNHPNRSRDRNRGRFQQIEQYRYRENDK